MIDIDLDSLPLGDVPRRNDPLGEFHCIRSDPRYAAWHEPTTHWTWRGSNWRVVEAGGIRAIEQLGHSLCNNTLIVSNAVERDIRAAEAEVHCPEVGQEVGLVFHYRTALEYLCFHLDADGKVKLSRRNHDAFDVLEDAPGNDLESRWLRLGIHREGGRLVCLVDGEPVLRTAWHGRMNGKVGLLANVPARFRHLRVDGKPPRRPLRRRGPRYPAMKVVRKIYTPGFGTARQTRFGDLTGDGLPDILLAQRQPEAECGYRGLGTLTAISTTGEVLWQSGEPCEQTPVAGDLPFQIHDIDGDGRNEVICVRDFQIQVLDGATGQLKLARPVPERPPHHPLLRRVVSYFGSPDHAQFPRVVANAIRFADLAGRGTPRDLLLKDVYHHLWAFSPDLEPLWSFCGNLGHFPFAADIDGDGREEVIAGYHILAPDGAEIQNFHLGDHADAVFATRLPGSYDTTIVRAAGDDGFLLSGLDGDLLTVRLGHVQRLSAARFLPDSPYLHFAICTYWGAPGIVALLDPTGKLLWAHEYPVCGNTLQPVNWTGDAPELIYFSAHPDVGGLFDWRGRQVVPLPRDGHPELCSEVLDLLGSGRDNLVVWDPERLWIYAPADDAEPRYRPRRPPLHSYSNYMAYWSIPPELPIL